MANNLSNYLEAALLNHHLGGSATLTKPATVYFALFTVTPSDSGGGTECVGTDYARVGLTNNSTNFPAASSSVITLSADVTFPTAGALGTAWGTIVAWGLFDASTSGNLLWWGPVATSKTVAVGDVVKFPSGSITFTLD